MKVLILALALSSVAAIPQHAVKVAEVNSERIIAAIVENFFNELFGELALIDPIYRPLHAGEWGLPNGEEIFSASGYVVGVRAAGFSNLRQNSITYNLWNGDFTIDIAFPSVSGSVDRAYGEINIFDYKLSASGSGRAVITGLRASASANIALGIGGVVVRDVDITLYLTGVDVELDLEIAGREIGEAIARFLNRLPYYVIEYKAQITAVLNYVAKVIIDRLL